MALVKVKLPTFECQRCGHKWHPKKAMRPVRCAFCKSPAWQTPKESPMRRRHELGCPCSQL